MSIKLGRVGRSVRAVLDTDVLIDVLRGFPAARQLFDPVTNHRLLCSAVTLTELWAETSPENAEIVHELIENVRVVPVESELARHAGGYMRRFSKSHAVSLPDSIIAATAYVARLPLLTRNLKHFPMDDIQIVKPY
jgi:predicted nucleic acid-binding protein